MKSKKESMKKTVLKKVKEEMKSGKPMKPMAKAMKKGCK